jgi:hypothetical protein
MRSTPTFTLNWRARLDSSGSLSGVLRAAQSGQSKVSDLSSVGQSYTILVKCRILLSVGMAVRNES